ncbi:MAG: hypothetical protein ABL984_03890 [Pyrinomonadaceae bacterium]
MKKLDLKKNLLSLTALSCLIAAGLGCNLADRLKGGNTSGTSSDSPSTDRPTPGTSKSDKRMYEDAEALADFVADLKSTLGTDDPKVLDLLVYDSYIMVKVQDPKKPENIDGYTYKAGSLGSPAPVKIIGNGKIEDNIFPLSEVNLAALPKLTEEIMGKLKDIEGGTMVGYSIDRGLPFNKEIGIDPLVNSTRKSITADADKSGKLVKWEVK